MTDYLKSLGRYIVFNTTYDSKVFDDSIMLDVYKTGEVTQLIGDIQPDVVVNCIGVLIRNSDVNPANAIYINSYFPHFLSGLLNGSESKLIHLSTDCVFSGSKGGYSEGDPHDGTGFYARSKSLGEVINNRDLTFRTSIIGPEINRRGEGLFHWFMKQKGEVSGYSGVYWSGVTTLELARATDAAIQQNLTGLYHLVAGQKISKYRLLELFAEIWECYDVVLKDDPGPVHDKSMICTRTGFDFDVKDYPDMLKELRRYMEAAPARYSEYRRS